MPRKPRFYLPNIAPSDYHWSSYQANACGQVNHLLADHKTMNVWETEPLERQARYRELLRSSSLIRSIYMRTGYRHNPERRWETTGS